jgi:predicted GIY-YIG superfamily endonuclease
MWWVYVLQSTQPRFTQRGKQVPGVCYVGSTTDPPRRLRQHNGEIVGGGRYTAKHRPWRPLALYGPYKDRSEAFKAEMILKRSKRGESRSRWSVDDHPLCRGEGAEHPWVTEGRWEPTPP